MRISTQLTRISIGVLLLVIGQLRNGFQDYEAKRYDEAVVHFDTIIEKYSDNDYTDDALYWSAKSLLHIGRNEDAEARLNKLLKLFPRSEFSDRAKQELSDLGLAPRPAGQFVNRADAADRLLEGLKKR